MTIGSRDRGGGATRREALNRNYFGLYLELDFKRRRCFRTPTLYSGSCFTGYAVRVLTDDAMDVLVPKTAGMSIGHASIR